MPFNKKNSINTEKVNKEQEVNSAKYSKLQSNIIKHMDKSEEIRLNKFISEKGLCSRREADKLIEQRRVTINGTIAETGTKVFPSDEVRLDGKLLSRKEDLVYIVLNKPVGITCTTEKKVKGNIVDFVNFPKRIFPIGRLDKDSQGLIFLTNDGDIVNKILRAGNNHEKEYIVTVNKPITQEFINSMSNGVEILDTITKKCYVKQESKFVFRIILTQGLNRQIRRMCEALDYNVTKLQRIRIMNVKLSDLPIGKWRYLTKSELSKIGELISQSVKTEEASTPTKN
jgi:23S rRNA pseudouridine2604 synthase